MIVEHADAKNSFCKTHVIEWIEFQVDLEGGNSK